MVSIDAVKRDIIDFSALIAKRPDSMELRASLADSLRSRISNLPSLSAADAIALTELVDQNCGVESVKDIVLTAIDCKVANVAFVANAPAAQDGEQSLTHLYNYLSGKDWAVLEDVRASETKKINVIATRLHRLGITQPGHDGCLKWGIVILVYCEHAQNKSWPSYNSIYNSFRDLVHHMKNTVGPFTRAALTSYPERPSDLPSALFKDAYDEDDPPVEKFIDLYISLGKHVPLRSDNILLKKEREGTWGADSDPRASGFEKLASQIHDMWKAGRGGSSASFAQTHVSTEAFKPKSTPMAQDTQLGSAPKPAPTAAASEPKATDMTTLQVDADAARDGESPEARIDQQTYEDQAYNALKNKANRASKKPAAAKAVAGVAKKPSASDVTMKRPSSYSAAKVVDFKVTFHPDDRQSSRNAFASKWYGRALTWAKHNKRSEKQSLVFARDAFKTAGEMWKSKLNA